MNPVDFPESNCSFKAPGDLTEGQCATIPAMRTEVKSGSCDGYEMVVVAWKPDICDLENINNGGLVYLGCLGGLPPHVMSTRLSSVLNPV